MPLRKSQKAHLCHLKALDTHLVGTRFLLQDNIHNSEEKKRLCKKKNNLKSWGISLNKSLLSSIVLISS